MVQITVQKYTNPPNKRRGKKLSRYPPSRVIDIHFGEHSREHNGQRGDIIYRGEQYGIRRADTGFRRPAIIINAYITAQQSDRLIGAADDDFDLIRARRARHYALRHNGEAGRACICGE